MRAPGRRGADAVRVLGRELEPAGARDRAADEAAAAVPRRRAADADAEPRAPPARGPPRAARRRGPRAARRDRGADQRQLRYATVPRDLVRRPPGDRRRGARAGARGRRRQARARRRRRSGDRRAAVPAGAARPRPADPHGRRTAHQQLPAVAGQLRRDPRILRVLARVRQGAPARRVPRLRPARAQVRQGARLMAGDLRTRAVLAPSMLLLIGVIYWLDLGLGDGLLLKRGALSAAVLGLLGLAGAHEYAALLRSAGF